MVTSTLGLKSELVNFVGASCFRSTWEILAFVRTLKVVALTVLCDARGNWGVAIVGVVFSRGSCIAGLLEEPSLIIMLWEDFILSGFSCGGIPGQPDY